VGLLFSQESLIGGALGFTDPTKQALDEAKRTFGTDNRVSVILSLGSGRRLPQSLDSMMNDVLDDMAYSGEQVAEELLQKFENSTFYHRFSVESGLENLSATNWSSEDLGAITSHTKVYIERVSSSLSAVVESLTKNEGTTTLGQLSKYLHPIRTSH
jgi:hypothetical protein